MRTTLIIVIISAVLAPGAWTAGRKSSLVTPSILDSFRSYSYAILQDKYGRKGSDEIGVNGFYTLGLGHLLTVINEKLWDVDTYGFDNALKAPRAKIFDYTRRILTTLTEDPDVTVYSNIYSSRPDLKIPERFASLRTDSSFVDYNGTTVTVNSVVAEINARIAVQTYARIYGTLVPEGGWWGMPFFNYTQAVLTNTFHFQGSLANPITQTVEGKFSDDEPLSLIETTGIPLTTHSDSYQAVRVPFKNSTKSLVLILPCRSVSTFVKEDLEAHLRKRDIEPTSEGTVRVQIPRMNFTIPNSYFKQLKKFGVTESMCRYDRRTPNTFETPVQNVYINLNEKLEFQVASATGTHVNNVEEYHRIHDNRLNSQARPAQDETSPTEDDPTEKSAEVNVEILSRMKSDFDHSEDIVKDILEIPVVHSRSEESDLEPSNIPESHGHLKRPSSFSSGNLLTFNRPFFYYVDDESLGPIFLGSVQSMQKYKKHEGESPPPGFEWQDEALKYLFWSCP